MKDQGEMNTQFWIVQTFTTARAHAERRGVRHVSPALSPVHDRHGAGDRHRHQPHLGVHTRRSSPLPPTMQGLVRNRAQRHGPGAAGPPRARDRRAKTLSGGERKCSRSAARWQPRVPGRDTKAALQNVSPWRMITFRGRPQPCAVGGDGLICAYRERAGKMPA